MSYTNLKVHIVFATKDRRRLLTHEIMGRLIPYVGGILRSERCALVAGGGGEDHVHLVASMHPDVPVSVALREIKSRSSGWVRQTLPGMEGFGWQEGYGAFSVSQSALRQVVTYVRKQGEHHRKMTFREEFVALLEKHGIEYDERYLPV